jgi:hypothetical protein
MPIRHAKHVYAVIEVERQDDKIVLVVETELPLHINDPAYEEGAFNELVEDTRRAMQGGGYDRATIRPAT